MNSHFSIAIAHIRAEGLHLSNSVLGREVGAEVECHSDAVAEVGVGILETQR